jgi:hypothetical protein
MLVTVTIRPIPGSHAGSIAHGIERARVQVEELTFEIPDDDLPRFKRDLANYVHEWMQGCRFDGLTVIIPHDVSWDYTRPVFAEITEWRLKQSQRV